MNTEEKVDTTLRALNTVVLHVAGLHYRVAVLESAERSAARSEATIIAHSVLAMLLGLGDISEIPEDALAATDEGLQVAFGMAPAAVPPNPQN